MPWWKEEKLVLRNTQSTDQKDTKVESSENDTRVAATEYDPTHTFTQKSMKVDAEVEGSQA